MRLADNYSPSALMADSYSPSVLQNTTAFPIRAKVTAKRTAIARAMDGRFGA